MTGNWFIDEVLKKDSGLVTNVTNDLNADLVTDQTTENRMNKGFNGYVTSVTSVTSKRRSPKVLSEIEEVKNWMIRTGRSQEDYLFRLIMEKCENDSEARQHFLEYSRTRKAHDTRPAGRNCCKCTGLGKGADCWETRKW